MDTEPGKWAPMQDDPGLNQPIACSQSELLLFPTTDMVPTAPHCPAAPLWNHPMRLAAMAVTVLALVIPAASGAADQASPVGHWRTFDDKTGRERGLMRIWEQNGVLYGSIEATVDPADARKTCDECTDDRKGKPIIGLNIIRGLHRDGERWDGGEILDPENGKTYSCSLRLTDKGRKLIVRGYLGISLLGRSQFWLRAD